METPVAKKIIAFGSKQVFLPKFTIALIRTPNLSPYHARFQVPLSFSKYDLRDYLHHAYSVKVHNIRSFIKQMPVRDTQKQPRHWFREESEKYMTVEMEKPFVWPEAPKDWSPWGKEEKVQSDKKSGNAQGVYDAEDKRIEARRLRQHAHEMLGFKEGLRQPKKVKSAKKDTMEGAEKTGAEQAKEKKQELLRKWEKQRSPQMLGRREWS